MELLQISWFVLVGVLLTGYAVLDGFDLGAGLIFLLSRKDGDRRTILNSIGPVWDGNEVWLLTGGGALFAAFPAVYATVFSGMYLALVLLLLALILRAVSIEVRGKSDDPVWRSAWDTAFGAGSLVAALLFGVALGNIMCGIPLDGQGNYTGGFFDLLNPVSLAVGLCGLFMLITHGTLYVAVKSEGELHERAGTLAVRVWAVYLVTWLAASVTTITHNLDLLPNYSRLPVLWLVPAGALAAIVATVVLIRRGSFITAFIASGLSIALNMAIVGTALFPRLVPSPGSPERSLTAFNASSSQNTLTVMLVIAAIGMPLVLGYTVFAYRTFKGKVGE
ncbi:MAG: cytochrome d ubiquinol oxidase subunit II [Myxococcota bacterium]